MNWTSESACRSGLSRLPRIIAGCQLLFLFLDHTLNPFPLAAIGAILEGPFQPLKLSPDRCYLCGLHLTETTIATRGKPLYVGIVVSSPAPQREKVSVSKRTLEKLIPRRSSIGSVSVMVILQQLTRTLVTVLLRSDTIQAK